MVLYQKVIKIWHHTDLQIKNCLKKLLMLMDQVVYAKSVLFLHRVEWLCMDLLCTNLQPAPKHLLINLLTINYLSMSYRLLFIPVNFPSTYILDRYGLRCDVTIGFLLSTIGLWLRCLINYNFWFVIAGQTLLALG